MNSLRGYLGDHLFTLRVTGEQVRRVDDLIGSQDRVLRALQTAVVNAVRDVATLCCAKIAGSMESAVACARSHLAKTRLIVELVDDEVEHFRHA